MSEYGPFVIVGSALDKLATQWSWQSTVSIIIYSMQAFLLHNVNKQVSYI